MSTQNSIGHELSETVYQNPETRILVTDTEDYIPNAANEWQEWLAQQEQESIDVYLKQPLRLISDYYKEREITRDYSGREILELLQNANDAAAELDIRGKVLVDLRLGFLIVANTGEPFSTGGVSSLIFSHISPKKRKKKNLIGHKGLGFRAALNWTSKPIIISGSLNLAYSQAKKEKVFERLKKSSTHLQRLVQKEQAYSSELFVPTLPFPVFIESNNVEVHSEEHLNAIPLLTSIRQDGYDTAIGLPFADQRYYEDAKQQIEALSSVLLLFVESIDEIDIRIEGEPYKRWKVTDRDKDNNRVNIQHNDGKEIEWKVYERSSKIPESADSRSTDSTNEFTITLATPINAKLSDVLPLYSYFPLDLEFPYPIVCHATLELEANRKHPRSNATNSYIVQEIAKFLAEVASAQDVERDPWARVRLVANLKDLDTYFLRSRFVETLLSTLTQCDIIPTLGTKHSKPQNTMLISARSIDWLPQPQFADIALIPPSEPIRRLYQALSIPELSQKDFVTRLNSLTFPDINTRAKLIARLIHNNVLPVNPTPDLLIDQNGAVIHSESRVFLSSRDQKKFDVPEWLSVRFVHDDLMAALIQELGVRDVRELRQNLSAFGVNEYSLDPIVRAVLAEARRKVQDEPTERNQIHADVLLTLYCLFQQRGDANFPKEVAVPLLSKSGDYCDARIMYFSNFYAANGDWLAELYKKTPEKLLADPVQLGIDGNDPEYLNFLRWLGVADFPREVIIDHVEREFKQFVLSSLPYGPSGIRLDEYVYHKVSDFNEPAIRSVKTIDGLDNILRSDPAAIITWLALDHQCSSWRDNRPGNLELSDRPHRAQYRRTYQGPLPHYAKWKIENTPWLPTVDGRNECPNRCIIGERSIEKVFPAPARFKHPLFEKYHIDAILIRRAWENAGVLPDLASLNKEQLLFILLSLPEKDPNGESAKTFYRSALERINPDEIGWEQPPEEFLKKGKMWGKGPKGKGYYPISKLHHADSEEFPEILTSHLNLVDLPKRVGSQRVKTLFGVEPLDKRKIQIDITQFEERIESGDLNSQFAHVKRYILALRQVKSKRIPTSISFQRLTLRFCSKLSSTLSYEDITFHSEVSERYQWILKDDVAYVYLPESENASLRSAMLADTLGRIFATLFNLESGGEFAQLIQCEDAERRELLKRLLGESELPNLEELAAAEGLDEIESPGILLPEIHKSESQGELKPEEVNLKKPDESKAPTSTQSTSPITADNLEISIEQHLPTTATKRREVVRRKTKVGGNALTGTHRVTDWQRCEDLIVAFEASDGRFALKVSNIVGYKGPRCDVLSFNTRDEFDRFIQSPGPERDVSGIARFIEVKASVNQKGAIELKGNELAGAQLYKERYYLYRVYEKTKTEYVVVVLGDPLNHREALNQIWEVDLFRANQTERFHIEVETSEPDSSGE
jgi:hypothetical protein